MTAQKVVTPLPRCRGVDVDPDWWVDPDAYPEDFPEGKVRKGSYSLETAYGRLQQKVRVDQLRAQILCYQCPLVFACRASAWDEPEHVWGGLTATERWQARRDGRIRPYDTFRASQNALLRSRVETAFLGGGYPDEIAATLNLQSKTVMYQIRSALTHARANAERGQQCLPTPPKFPFPISRAGFRLGLADSSASTVEAA